MQKDYSGIKSGIKMSRIKSRIKMSGIKISGIKMNGIKMSGIKSRIKIAGKVQIGGEV